LFGASEFPVADFDMSGSSAVNVIRQARITGYSEVTQASVLDQTATAMVTPV